MGDVGRLIPAKDFLFMRGVYKITNPLGQIYIGSSNNIFNRWYIHGITAERDIKATTKINESILKHGVENHKFDILERCDKHKFTTKDLLQREKYWQKYYRSYLDDNLNINISGNTKYVNGKRQRIETTKKSFYLDITTGVFYYSIKEVANALNIKKANFNLKLYGYRGKVNDTGIIRV